MDPRRTRDYQPDSPLDLNYLTDPTYTPLDKIGGPGPGVAGSEDPLSPSAFNALDDRLGNIQQLGEQRRGLEDRITALQNQPQTTYRGMSLGEFGSMLGRGLNAITPSQDTLNSIGMRLQNMGASYAGRTPLWMLQQQHAMNMQQADDLMAMRRQALAQELQKHNDSIQQNHWNNVFKVMESNLTPPQQHAALVNMGKSGNPVAFDMANNVNAKMIADFKLVQPRLGMSPDQIVQGLQSGDLTWHDLSARVTAEKKSMEQEKQALADDNAKQQKIQGLYDKFNQDPMSLTDSEHDLLKKHLDEKAKRQLEIQQMQSQLSQQTLNNQKAQLELNMNSVLPKEGASVPLPNGQTATYVYHPQDQTVEKVIGTKPPVASVTTNVDTKTGASLAGKAGDIAEKTLTKATAAAQTVSTINRLHESMESNKFNLGPTATIRSNIDRYASLLGIGGNTPDERLANTRVMMKGLAELTLAGRGSLKGEGSVSNYESDLAKQAASGDIDSFTPKELKAFLNVAERVARNDYAQHGRILSKMRSKSETKDLADYYEAPPLEPSYSAPTKATIQSLPKGSKQVGTYNGKPVYEDATGKRWIGK